MKSFKLERWVKQVAETQEEEISCSQCLDRVDAYVDAQVAGIPLSPEARQLRQHLRQCKVCREEYEVLRELAELEKHGPPPSVDELRNSF